VGVPAHCWLRLRLRCPARSRSRRGTGIRCIIVLVADLIVVTGPPGAGKTSAARALSAMFTRSVLVSGDDFFGFVDQGYVAPWTVEAHEQNDTVMGAAAAAAGRFAAGGFAVVYDGVVGPWFLDAFIAGTGLDWLHYVMLLPPEAICLERVHSRVGHGFADLEATRHMYRQFADAGISARHVLRGVEDVQSLALRIFGLVESGAIVWLADHQARSD
jgi:hypothetical protein